MCDSQAYKYAFNISLDQYSRVKLKLCPVFKPFMSHELKLVIFKCIIICSVDLQQEPIVG